MFATGEESSGVCRYMKHRKFDVPEEPGGSEDTSEKTMYKSAI